MNDKELSTQIMNFLSLQKLLKEKIQDEKHLKNEWHEGRVSAFKFILEILEDDGKES